MESHEHESYEHESRAEMRRRNREEKRNARMARRGDGSLFVTIIVCLITLMALTGCVILILEVQQLRQNQADLLSQLEDQGPHMNESTFQYMTNVPLDDQIPLVPDDEAITADDVLEELRIRLTAGEDLSAILRAIYHNHIVVGADGRFHFFPIDNDLAMHDYIPDNFMLDEHGVLTYQDDDGYILSQKGIDVSRYQLDIDWERVAAAGVEFAIIRLGFRGSSEGALFLDPFFEANIEGAIANGIDVGVYFFTQALNVEEVLEEAEFILEHIEGYDLAYPVVIDIEAIGTTNPRTQNMTREEWTEVAIAFCERIKEAGYTPMIYGNLHSFFIMLDISRLEEYEKWFAFFRTPIYFPYQHSIWQYTARGTVDGIEGDVDLNVGMRRLLGNMP
jgi:GH25 family lysozyme M1 (1,4-beta-N-acetylmuramidase)